MRFYSGPAFFAFLIAITVAFPARVFGESKKPLEPYRKKGQLEPLPEGKASLYRAPWRSNSRTVSAYAALQKPGIYYKHVPDWTESEHFNVMQQLYEVGVRRLQFAPHWTIYITADWEEPAPGKRERLGKKLRAARAAGIRPYLGVPRIPPFGKPGTRQLQKWWGQGELMPVGEVGSPEFNAYADKAYLALKYVVEEARKAGFTEPESYDMGVSMGLWWGVPSVTEPPPGATLATLQPGGRVYEFEKRIIQHLAQDGYRGPRLLKNIHHNFSNIPAEEKLPNISGRVVSIYGVWTGKTNHGWLNNTQYERPRGVKDIWPVRNLEFMEGKPPTMVLARPESWMADFSRHDNLIHFLKSNKLPVAMNSIGAVPRLIPEFEKSPFSGWEVKQRSLTRILAFWMNQGAEFVLLHSFYEGQRGSHGEMMHSLAPGLMDPKRFRWQDAPPLRTMKRFMDGLEGAIPLERITPLHFEYSVEPNPVLIPRTGRAGPMRAQDQVALLPFQLDGNSYAVAAYICTPNIAERMKPLVMTLKIDRKIQGPVEILRPYNGLRIIKKVKSREEQSSTLRFTVYDDVTWLRFSGE